MQRLKVVSWVSAAGADIEVCEVHLDGSQEAALEQILGWLYKLGHVVSFALHESSAQLQFKDMRERLTRSFGSLVTDAIWECELTDREPAAAFLTAVAPFDEGDAGVLTSTMRFLNTEVEVVAFPSFSEEAGFTTRGRKGLYLPLFLPLHDRQSYVI